MKIIFGVCLLFLASAGNPSVLFAADQSAFEEDVNAKLDEIVKNEKQILAQLDEMKQELYVIKVRATKR